MSAISRTIDSPVSLKSSAICSKYLNEKSAVVVIALTALSILVFAIIKRDAIAKFLKSTRSETSDSQGDNTLAAIANDSPPSSSSTTSGNKVHLCISTNPGIIHVNFSWKKPSEFPCNSSDLIFKKLAAELNCDITEVQVIYGNHSIEYDASKADVCFQELFEEKVGIKFCVVNTISAIIKHSLYSTLD